MTNLHISDRLSLPLDFVVWTQAIVATKGMGKSHLAQVEAEELLERRQVIVAIDPTDAWWGLRSSADGRSDGYPITIFGGDHGDLKLEPDAGALIADAVMEKRFSCVICTEGLTQSGEVKLVREFLERLYRKNREPIHLFVDEADMFAPQKPDDPEDAKSIRALRNVVRRGRKKGIGCTMITQRPAELNKGVLSMCEMLMVLGMEHPLDIDPIERWVRTADPKVGELAAEMIAGLPTLPQGDAWAWARRRGIHKQFRARAKNTFDSGATPKPGQRVREAKRLAPVDVAQLGAAIAATVERQKAEDPRTLKARIAELEKRPAAAPAKPAKVVQLDSKRLDKAIEKLQGISRELAAEAEASIARFNAARNELDRTMMTLIAKTTPPASPPATLANGKPQAAIVRRQAVPAPAPKRSGDGIGEGERKLLAAIVQHGGATPEKLTVLCGYKRSSRNTYLQRLGSRGLVVRDRDQYIATPDGIAEVGDVERLPTGSELRSHWMAKLPEGEATILAELIQAYPAGLDREVIADGKYKRSSRNTYIQRLAARGLVVTDRNAVAASSELFS